MTKMTKEEAIKFIIKDKEQRGDCYISEALDMAIRALEQKPKTGQWIKKEIIMESDFSTVKTYRDVCSHCGIINVSKYKNYCPNCGYRMSKPQESEG